MLVIKLVHVLFKIQRIRQVLPKYDRFADSSLQAFSWLTQQRHRERARERGGYEGVAVTDGNERDLRGGSLETAKKPGRLEQAG